MDGVSAVHDILMTKMADTCDVKRVIFDPNDFQWCMFFDPNDIEWFIRMNFGFTQIPRDFIN